MAKLLNSDPRLGILNQFLQKRIKTSIDAGNLRHQLPPNLANSGDEALTQAQRDFKTIRAIRLIQQVWQNKKINQQMIENPYSSYLSLVDKASPHYHLSSRMFGRRMAEFPQKSVHYIANPFFHPSFDKSSYHRFVLPSSLNRANEYDYEFTRLLMSAFNIDDNTAANNEFLLITVLNNTPIEYVLNKYFPNSSPAPSIHRSQRYSFLLLAIPYDNPQLGNIIDVIRACGLVPPPWEIAENVTIPSTSATIDKFTAINPNLPTTTAALIASKIFYKLKLIANNQVHCTDKLASCLQNLILGLPEISGGAIQRISLMIELANTFHKHNYTRYSFYVYVVIHEISLILLQLSNDSVFVEQLYAQFRSESQQTLLQALKLEINNLSNTLFIACPTISGTNAYTLAMKLALQMKTHSGITPAIQIYDPFYYEFNNTTSNNGGGIADIVVLSAGPIVNKDGLYPGIDLNRFLQSHFIDNKRRAPMTVIIDTTTALYHNLRLTKDTRLLVEQGIVSILVHESHQKFWLIHSDQAQYGRLFGICSKNSYSAKSIAVLQSNSREDFNQHLDLRIGAFINSTCSAVLEKIKQQHFSNGALLRNILGPLSIIKTEIIPISYRLTNRDELYFILSRTNIDWIESRVSFGHFCTTQSKVCLFNRICLNASDAIDCLILAVKIYLNAQHDYEFLIKKITNNALNFTKLSIVEQIICLAMFEIMINKSMLFLRKKNVPEIFAAFNHLLPMCSVLKGRESYAQALNFLSKLKNKAIEINARIASPPEVNNWVHNRFLFMSNTACVKNKKIELEFEDLLNNR